MVRPTDHSPPAVPPDALHLGRGHLLDAGRIALLLALNQDDLSRITNVATTSVKIGDAMPPAMREWIEDIANMMNMVAQRLVVRLARARRFAEDFSHALGMVGAFGNANEEAPAAHLFGKQAWRNLRAAVHGAQNNLFGLAH